ncbi:GNAT family N-acetyltransferase [Bradyrhizobium sp. HKCCYLRH2060]|uniref:GNAT family N-acetyltransferase n=1 Tax=Bradyrhizobium TaxID=374 RepID=UPI003EB81892
MPAGTLRLRLARPDDSVRPMSDGGKLDDVHITWRRSHRQLLERGEPLTHDIGESRVTLEIADNRNLQGFKKELREAFSAAVMDEVGSVPDQSIPSDDDIEQSVNAAGAVTYQILLDGTPVGGAVLTIDPISHHNSLDLFYISIRQHGRGIGQRAWHAIEARYPDTKVWQTFTPYFEKRNIHFYVNKCGFKIVEYYNAYNPLPHQPPLQGMPDDGDFFRFEKLMQDGR